MAQDTWQASTDSANNMDEDLLPPFEELIAPLPQPEPLEDLKKFEAAFNRQAQGGLRAVVWIAPGLTNAAIPKQRYVFYIETGRPNQPKEELFHSEHDPAEALATQRYPVTLYYPSGKPYFGAALYDRGIVLLEDGTYAEDTLSDALRRIFRSKYVQDLIGRLYRAGQEPAP